MLKTTFRKASVSIALLVLFIAALASLAQADSTIYRCGPADSQWFSQIPCEENSEQVIVEDHAMFNEAGAGTHSAGSSQAGQGTAELQDASSKAQAFISQLEKQRNEQLAEIDRDIEELQSRAGESDTDKANSDANNDSSNDANSHNEAASVLASLQNNRESIQSEYEAMITAARQRIDKP